MKTIRVGSRDSRLAIIQSGQVIEAIRKYAPEIRLELVTMKTTGDIILDQTLDKIGGKGLFVKELDDALKNHQVDITVHSLKDMPMDPDSMLPIMAVSKREDPRDVLILPKGAFGIDQKKPIGCSSARRRIFIKRLFPGIETQPVRGNVLTRIKKLDDGEYSALVLAAAGIKRLGLEDRITRAFSVEEVLPAACQGIIAVQGRAGENTDYLRLFADEQQMLCAKAERAFVRALNGGCSSPAAAYARYEGENISVTGMYVNDDETVLDFATRIAAPIHVEDIARTMAEEMKNAHER